MSLETIEISVTHGMTVGEADDKTLDATKATTATRIMAVRATTITKTVVAKEITPTVVVQDHLSNIAIMIIEAEVDKVSASLTSYHTA